eukprot:TRINITY_DN1020_c0_g1_i1.p2 TRINITY_DN1020_c0_g1~~TRINITY_DN1020_c0_g1_i1.p2  ORF type:complete len:108 (-),score=24.26 TRINITY_DN1020_c0_g1_i1:126-449(-)
MWQTHLITGVPIITILRAHLFLKLRSQGRLVYQKRLAQSEVARLRWKELTHFFVNFKWVCPVHFLFSLKLEKTFVVANEIFVGARRQRVCALRKKRGEEEKKRDRPI